LAGGVQEEAAIELNVAVVDADGEPLMVGVDVGDRAAVAVGDAALVVVALDDDPVAGGERAAGQLQFGSVETACGAHGVAKGVMGVGAV
jgi:hypothetical protein